MAWGSSRDSKASRPCCSVTGQLLSNEVVQACISLHLFVGRPDLVAAVKCYLPCCMTRGQESQCTGFPLPSMPVTAHAMLLWLASFNATRSACRPTRPQCVEPSSGAPAAASGPVDGGGEERGALTPQLGSRCRWHATSDVELVSHAGLCARKARGSQLTTAFSGAAPTTTLGSLDQSGAGLSMGPAGVVACQRWYRASTSTTTIHTAMHRPFVARAPSTRAQAARPVHVQALFGRR